MADQTPSKLDPDAHLLLEQPLLRLPHELLKKNLKSAQRAIEPVNKQTTTAIANSSSQSPADTLASLDATLAKAQNLKRKLEALHAEEQTLHRQQKARIQHLQVLHEIPSVGDVAFERWSHVRLDRLLVDYLLRQGFGNSAKQLVEEKGLQDLVDVGVFEEAGRIESALRRGEVREALGWCAENRNALKKMNSELEMELRLQQFIELLRQGDLDKQIEAVAHARKYFLGEQNASFAFQAGGLLTQPEDTFAEPYRTLFSPSRYTHLSSLFLNTHHTLLSLPSTPLLHIALSAGLSALKTPACHSQHISPSTTTSICPICSTELNELARGVPYAHHTKSWIEDDPVVLPNGRIFGRERLRGLCEKLGVRKGWVRDPTQVVGGDGGVEWEEGVLRKVFIS